jgi:hypothetical protein
MGNRDKRGREVRKPKKDKVKPAPEKSPFQRRPATPATPSAPPAPETPPQS